jgi:hypothetical protein
LLLYLFTVFALPVPLQYSLPLLKGQPLDVLADVYCSQGPRARHSRDMCKHYITAGRKNCNYTSFCSKDIDYQRVSTFFWTPLHIQHSWIYKTITIILAIL